ncbi:hypothetical protein FIBSPDRAFT_903906 [Athelia psychrophila]|uniref:Uncharacterized protein n=1 Tax=Athelia psychrophila TaxID=1759441 RepID=A0A167VEB8_9AGAM|nr:hypothetical protein FIBSPDRAFT_903906 [Fibularhizoctonia sp. CBS 109695]
MSRYNQITTKVDTKKLPSLEREEYLIGTRRIHLPSRSNKRKYTTSPGPSKYKAGSSPRPTGHLRRAIKERVRPGGPWVPLPQHQPPTTAVDVEEGHRSLANARSSTVLGHPERYIGERPGLQRRVTFARLRGFAGTGLACPCAASSVLGLTSYFVKRSTTLSTAKDEEPPPSVPTDEQEQGKAEEEEEEPIEQTLVESRNN